MEDQRREIWFWQRIVSPHMAGLAAALTEDGCEVVYVAERAMSDERARQGWAEPGVGEARLELVPSAEAVRVIAKTAPSGSIHICQGIRGNGFVRFAQRELARRRLSQWVVMETVDDEGVKEMLKRFAYAALIQRWRRKLRGILAIGHRTPEWVAARGMPSARVFPFAYFLPDRPLPPVAERCAEKRYRIVFAGQLIPRKRVDLLIEAVFRLASREVELVVVGSGPLEAELRAQADRLIPGRARWRGRLPMAAVFQELASADCLVLPSRHDGWGAVVSEALMVGTPVVCSDACGSANVVRASGKGGVFKSGDCDSLTEQLGQVLETGSPTADDRRELALWARSLGAKAGAAYLLDILDNAENSGSRPVPPWEQVRNAGKDADLVEALL